MTLTQKSMRKVISGDGWSNPLTHAVYLENATHLKVYADGVELVLGDDYTVDELQNEAGYEVTIASFAPGTEPEWYFPDVWVLSVEPPINQPSDVSLGGSFGQRYEDALDVNARRMQRIYDMALRAFKSPMTLDPASLNQTDLTFDPSTFSDFQTKYEIIIQKAAEVAEDADSAHEDAIQTAVDRVQTGQDRALVSADKGTVAADKALVALDRVAVAADRIAVAADRVDVQNDKSLTAQFADSAAESASTAVEAAATILNFSGFAERYLGEHATDPVNWNASSPLDPGTDPLIAGLMYYNTAANEYRTYSGSEWQGGSGDAPSLALNGSDYDAAAFRANIDVRSASEGDLVYAPAVHTHTVSQLSDASANGRSLIAAANYAAMRTLLDLEAGTDFYSKTAADAAFQAIDPQLSSLVRQNSKSADYTFVLTDGGKHIYHPAADTTPRTWTFPANASVPYPIGTVITLDNDVGAGDITIAITSDTLVLVGAGTTGSRLLASGGQATALKVAATRWRISGTWLT